MNHIFKSHKHYAEQEKPDTKECLLQNSISMKIKKKVKQIYCNRNYNCVCLVVGLTEKVQEDTSRVMAILSILTVMTVKTQPTVHLRFVNFTEYKYNLIKRIWKLIYSKADVLNDYYECWHKLIYLIGKQYCYINQEYLRAFILYGPFNKFPFNKSILRGYLLNLKGRGIFLYKITCMVVICNK